MVDIKGPFWIEEWLDNRGKGTGNYAILIGEKEDSSLVFTDQKEEEAVEFAGRLNTKILEWIAESNTKRDFLYRETLCFKRYRWNSETEVAEKVDVAGKVAGVLHILAEGLRRGIAYCYKFPELLSKGYAYEFPLTITIDAIYDGPSVKIGATASANGAILDDQGSSIPILKTVKEIVCEESP